MVETLLGIVVLVILVAVVLGALFMLIGAKMAGVGTNATFGRALGAAIACSLMTWIAAAVFSVVPVLGTALGFIIGLILSLMIIKAIFDTSFGRALLTWIFNILAQVVAAVAVIVGGGFSVARLLSH
jgi:hypothetical protein